MFVYQVLFTLLTFCRKNLSKRCPALCSWLSVELSLCTCPLLCHLHKSRFMYHNVKWIRFTNGRQYKYFLKSNTLTFFVWWQLMIWNYWLIGKYLGGLYKMTEIQGGKKHGYQKEANIHIWENRTGHFGYKKLRKLFSFQTCYRQYIYRLAISAPTLCRQHVFGQSRRSLPPHLRHFTTYWEKNVGPTLHNEAIISVWLKHSAWL